MAVGQRFSPRHCGRSLAGESEAQARDGYARLFASAGLNINAGLVLFPEMDAAADVPEISTACWGILGQRPDALMCASSRMVVKRRGAARPVVAACTLLPYDDQFTLGATLGEASGRVQLNHPHCARFLRAGRGELFGLSLSVVIPALNAAATLPACLARLDGADEIILVDGGSTDDTVRIAEAAGARVVIAPKGRGIQLRAGGRGRQGRRFPVPARRHPPGPGLAKSCRGASPPRSAPPRLLPLPPRRSRLASARDRTRRRAAHASARLALWRSGPAHRQGALRTGRRLPSHAADGGCRPRSPPAARAHARGGRADLGRALAPRRLAAPLRRNLLCLGLYRAGASPERVARLYARR
jgi:hypothetical protein